jgi:rhodanese-related sulfurtransferase
MRVRMPEVAKDLVQETFLVGIRSLEKFAGRSSERSWLVGHLENKIRQGISRRSNDKRHISGKSAQCGRRSKHQVVVFYCSAGVRSSNATARLIKSGHTNVFNLQGSIFQWANERRPVLRDGEVVDVVHPYDERWGVLLDSQLHPGAQQ